MTAVAPSSSPQSPLTAIRGAGYPALNAPAKDLVRFVQTCLTDTNADAEARYRKATQNLLFADGRQHIDWSLKDKTWKDAPEDGRRRVTMNYIRPILRSRAQRLMSSELSWRAVPRSNAHEERDKCTVAGNLLESRWKGSEMDAKARQAIFLADNCGVAYFKQFWNPSIGPMTTAQVVAPHPMTGQPTTYPVDAQGHVLADDQGNPLDGNDLGFQYRPGDTDTALRSIFNVRLNPDAQGLEANEGFRWLTDSEAVPISVVKARWGDRAKNVQATQGIGPMRQYERIVRAIAGRLTGQTSDLSQGRGANSIPDRDVTLYIEYWEARSEELPNGRLIVVAGDECLYPVAGQDEEGLPQGFVPHVAVYSERRPFDAYGRPMVDDLIQPQRVVNAQWSAILEEQALAGGGQWAMFDIPGLSDQITNLNAAHIKVPVQSAFANRGIGDLIQRVAAPSVSADRWRLLDAAKATMFDIGAFHEIQRGQVPPGVDSGIAVQLLQEAENGQMFDSVRGLKRSFIQWGRQTGMLAKWGYGENEERWISQNQPQLGFLVESIKGTDLPDFETQDIDLEGFRPSSQAAMNAEIKDAMVNMWIPPDKGLKLMDLGRGVTGLFESQGRHYIRARGENLAIQRKQYIVQSPPPHTPQALLGVPAVFLHPDGGSFLLPQDDDHLIHIEVHQEIFLDDTRPLPERQAMGLHIAEHRAVVMQQIQANAVREASMKAGPPKEPANAGGPSND